MGVFTEGARPQRVFAAALLGVLASCAPGSHEAFRVLPDGVCQGATAPASSPPAAPTTDPALVGQTHHYFQITVTDAATQAPIPGVVLTMTNNLALTTDQNGVVAFYEPGLMGTSVWFTPTHPAYQIDADALGWRGKAFAVTEGGAGALALTKIADAPTIVADDLQTRLLALGAPSVARCFGLRFIDRVTRRGVPLVFVTTPDGTETSDSQGVVAYCHPDHVGTAVTFTVTSHGYTLPNGALTLPAIAGTTAVVELDRQNIAERLYRVTGQGIYRDSVLLGLTTPLADPNIDGLVMGQDTAKSARYHGQIFWLWGDTARASYPLGNLVVSGAQSTPPGTNGDGALDPSVGVNLRYFVGSDGFSRGMIDNIAPTDTPMWMTSLFSVDDASGGERLFGTYIKPTADLGVASRGLAQFDDATETFTTSAATFALDGDGAPAGQAFAFAQADAGHVYFGAPVRVAANAAAAANSAAYESFTAVTDAKGTLARAGDGGAAYAWRAGGPFTTAAALKSAGLAADQSLDGHVADADTNAPVAVASTGGEAWSARRGRFVKLVEAPSAATSAHGDVWYLEADTPMGPWAYARRIMTHDDYSFYGLWVHPELAAGAADPFVYFEGTYSKRFAGAVTPVTPRYEYNQLMYRVDLSDARLALPVPVYRTDDTDVFAVKASLPTSATASISAAFFAPDEAASGTVAVFWSGPSCAPRALRAAASPETSPLFYAVAATDPTRASFLVPLYDDVDADGNHSYATTGATVPAGATRASTPVAYVWPSPMSVKLPVNDYRPAIVANAGPDRCLSEARAGAGVDLTLSAAGSTTGSGVTYTWTRLGATCPFAVTSEARVHVASGVTSFTLTVSDASGNASTDQVIVGVAPGPGE